MIKGLCPKCGDDRKGLSKHHICPRQHWGNGETFLLCRSCHDKLHRILDIMPKLARVQYYIILVHFINEGKS